MCLGIRRHERTCICMLSYTYSLMLRWHMRPSIRHFVYGGLVRPLGGVHWCFIGSPLHYASVAFAAHRRAFAPFILCLFFFPPSPPSFFMSPEWASVHIGVPHVGPGRPRPASLFCAHWVRRRVVRGCLRALCPWLKVSIYTLPRNSPPVAPPWPNPDFPSSRSGSWAIPISPPCF